MTLPRCQGAELGLSWLTDARERYGCRESLAVPLRVTAHLLSPLAVDRALPIRLDGALSWVVVALATGAPPPEAFGAVRKGAWVEIPTPIADAEIRGWRVPRCSDATLPSVAVDSVRRRRRRADADALGLAKVMTAGGPWKALDMPTPTVATPSAEWWCVADEERLCALLSEIHALGRGRSGGLGAVGAWRVERVAEDRGLTHDGMPTRALPILGPEQTDTIRRAAASAVEHPGSLHWGRAADSVASAMLDDAAHDEAERLYPGCEVREDAVRPPHWHRAVKTLCACPVWAPGC